jgi:hypothetical protein
VEQSGTRSDLSLNNIELLSHTRELMCYLLPFPAIDSQVMFWNPAPLPPELEMAGFPKGFLNI